jgi:hypothetical protein
MAARWLLGYLEEHQEQGLHAASERDVAVERVSCW